MGLLEVLYIAVGVATLIYAFIIYTYSYWDRKGFKTYPGVNYLVGHFGAVFRQEKHIAVHHRDIYRSTTEPFIGIYGVLRPILFVRDPKLIRNILIKDFAHFSDRAGYCNEKRDPLSGNLFQLPGERWRNLRRFLTPAFSSGKLKSMFSTLVNCGMAVENYLENAVKKDELIDIRELTANMTTNVIASVGFGISVDSINNPLSDFRKFGRKIFEPSLRSGIRGAIFFAAPELMKYLPIKALDADIEDFIFQVVKQNLEYREQQNVTRKDFFQLLVQLRNKGCVQLDDQWETVIKTDEKKLSLEEIAAQVFIFFAAGFETSSATMSYCLYELAKNPEIQQRVHEDIDRVLAKHGGHITYECVSEMEYLECCIDEVSRKYPVASLLFRKCTKDYKIEGTDNVIEKGVEVLIPLLGLHRDEQFYPDPDAFKPERFNAENSAGKNQMNLAPYYPFGGGPRNCIGMRLGKMQTKVGILLMLKEFRFELDLINQELDFDPKTGPLIPLQKIYLKAFKRNS